MQTNLDWTPPGPGPWETDAAHFPRPVPHFGREGFARGFAAGFAESTARYGLLLSHFEPTYVNGFMYRQPIAFGAPKGAMGPPPKPVLWLLTRLHPAMRARIKDSERAFANRMWREDLRRWDEVDKPAAIARHRALLAVDPRSLDDSGLAAHVDECDAHAEAMVALHHRYTIPCMLPIGDLLAHVAEWTQVKAGELLSLLRGSSPISNGILASELEALASAIRDDAGARAILAERDPVAIIERLTSLDGPVGDAAREFFDAVRHRAVSYEVSARAAGEMPSMLVGTLRVAVEKRGAKKPDADSSAADAIRAAVPERHRARFDELLAEARSINRLRDERGVYSDGFAVGIARRVALEVGRRLAERGLLHDAEHAVDLTTSEAKDLLAGKRGPTPDDVAARVNWRTTKSVADIPPFLGGEPGGPPDPSVLPPAARRATRAVDAAIKQLFVETEAESTKTVIRGISVNDGEYEGIARRIEDASEFSRIEHGDVLVTRATAPYFNVVLPLLGAIVTDRGGQLCHAAIVAREYGIPGIVGTKVATATIPDGARVRVDGRNGEVTILSVPG